MDIEMIVLQQEKFPIKIINKSKNVMKLTNLEVLISVVLIIAKVQPIEPIIAPRSESNVPAI